MDDFYDRDIELYAQGEELLFIFSWNQYPYLQVYRGCRMLEIIQ